MPKNKFQAAVFGVIMSYAMAIGMEVYNVAMREGVQLTPGGLSNMTNSVFLGALEEAWYMGLLVVLFSNLWGSRLGAAVGAGWCDARRDSPALCQLMRQAGTVAVMCPTMSLAATILFYGILGATPVFQLPAVWVGTVLKNFPMAFFWNMFAASPFTRWAFRRLFAVKG